MGDTVFASVDGRFKVTWTTAGIESLEADAVAVPRFDKRPLGGGLVSALRKVYPHMEYVKDDFVKNDQATADQYKNFLFVTLPPIPTSAGQRWTTKDVEKFRDTLKTMLMLADQSEVKSLAIPFMGVANNTVSKEDYCVHVINQIYQYMEYSASLSNFILISPPQGHALLDHVRRAIDVNNKKYPQFQLLSADPAPRGSPLVSSSIGGGYGGSNNFQNGRSSSPHPQTAGGSNSVDRHVSAAQQPTTTQRPPTTAPGTQSHSSAPVRQEQPRASATSGNTTAPHHPSTQAYGSPAYSGAPAGQATPHANHAQPRPAAPQGNPHFWSVRSRMLLADDIFSVASYNVLGQSFVTMQFAPYAADATFGKAQFRHNLLIKQLACLDSSIIALQEVQPNFFNLLRMATSDKGELAEYQLTVMLSMGTSTIAVLTKKRDWSVVPTDNRDHMMIPSSFQDNKESMFMILRSKKMKFETGLLAVHLVGDPTMLQERKKDMHQALSTIHQLYPGLPLIICGDFNDDVDSPVVDFLKDYQGEFAACTYNFPTFRTHEISRAVDHFFFSKDAFAFVAKDDYSPVPLNYGIDYLNNNQPVKVIPSPHHPSDHIPVVMYLRYKGEPRGNEAVGERGQVPAREPAAHATHALSSDVRSQVRDVPVQQQVVPNAASGQGPAGVQQPHVQNVAAGQGPGHVGFDQKHPYNADPTQGRAGMHHQQYSHIAAPGQGPAGVNQQYPHNAPPPQGPSAVGMHQPHVPNAAPVQGQGHAGVQHYGHNGAFVQGQSHARVQQHVSTAAPGQGPSTSGVHQHSVPNAAHGQGPAGVQQQNVLNAPRGQGQSAAGAHQQQVPYAALAQGSSADGVFQAYPYNAAPGQVPAGMQQQSADHMYQQQQQQHATHTHQQQQQQQGAYAANLYAHDVKGNPDTVPFENEQGDASTSGYDAPPPYTPPVNEQDPSSAQNTGPTAYQDDGDVEMDSDNLVVPRQP